MINIDRMLFVAEYFHDSLGESIEQEDDAEETPSNEEAHQPPDTAGQIPDVVGIEFILTGEAGCLDIEIK